MEHIYRSCQMGSLSLIGGSGYCSMVTPQHFETTIAVEMEGCGFLFQPDSSYVLAWSKLLGLSSQANLKRPLETTHQQPTSNNQNGAGNIGNSWFSLVDFIIQFPTKYSPNYHLLNFLVHSLAKHLTGMGVGALSLVHLSTCAFHAAVHFEHGAVHGSISMEAWVVECGRWCRFKKTYVWWCLVVHGAGFEHLWTRLAKVYILCSRTHTYIYILEIGR